MSVVFVVSKESAPPEGELVGDILYVNVADGYRNIVRKTRAMLYLVSHSFVRFSYQSVWVCACVFCVSYVSCVSCFRF